MRHLLLGLFALASCGAPPPPPPPAPEAGDTGPVVFEEDPLAQLEEPEGTMDPVEGAPADPDAGANTLYFPEDPLADPSAEIIGAGSQVTEEQMFERRPDRILVELDAPPNLPTPDEDFIRRSSEMALARLKARAFAEELGRTAVVSVDEGPHTFGTILPVRFRVQNPYGDTVELLPSAEGLVLELEWTVERWLPIAGHDRVTRHRFFRVAQRLALEGGESFEEFADLPLALEGDPGSLWVVRIDARIRCAGALLGEEVLPVPAIEFQASQVLALPPGWERFAPDPLRELERLIAAPEEEVDRNLLVCAALLRGDERYRAVDLMLDGLEAAPHDRRRLTMTQVLQWMTGLPLGSLPEDWLRWRERRRMAAADEQP
jgi:hypothetical protein